MLESALLKAEAYAFPRTTNGSNGAQSHLDDLLNSVLRQMMTLGHATGGLLFLLDQAQESVLRRASAGEVIEAECGTSGHVGLASCPAVVDSQSIILQGPRHRWYQECRRVSVKGGAVNCVSLTTEHGPLGMVQLQYSKSAPAPLTRYLSALERVAEHAAPVIKQARDEFESQTRSVETQHRLRREHVLNIDRGETPIEPSPVEQVEGTDASPKPFLDIRCFGVFELHREGRRITPDMIQRRGAISLLKILLVHAGRPVPRDVLLELLWPESDPALAANRLHTLVHSLRQLVEPSPSTKEWVFIRNDGDRYFFDANGPCSLDLDEFRRCIAIGERLEHEGDLAGAANAFEAVVGLYRGDFLEDDLYSEWIWEEREHLRETCLNAIRKLAARHMEQGRFDEPIELYRRALRLDPAREQNHQGLMAALLATGRRDEALRQYEACKEALRRELDVRPLPETEHLYRLALNGST